MQISDEVLQEASYPYGIEGNFDILDLLTDKELDELLNTIDLPSSFLCEFRIKEQSSNMLVGNTELVLSTYTQSKSISYDKELSLAMQLEQLDLTISKEEEKYFNKAINNVIEHIKNSME